MSAHFFWLLAVAASLLTGAFVLAPELAPAIVASTDEVWTPFNSANFKVGDMYYYAPMIQEVLLGRIPPVAPNGTDSFANSPEALRWLNYMVAALPGFIIDDPRAPILWTLFFPPAAGAFVTTVLAAFLTGRGLHAVIVGVLAALSLQFWQFMPATPDVYSGHGIFSWTVQTLQSLRGTLGRSMDVYDTFAYSELFRFMIPGVSFVLLSAFVLTLVWLVDRPRAWRAVLVAVFASLMAFTYPSQMLIAYLAMIGMLIANLVQRDVQRVGVMLFAGLATLGFLFLTGHPAKMLAVFSDQSFVSAVYGSSENLVVAPSLLSVLAAVMMSKYSIGAALSVLCATGNPALQRLTLIVGGIACLLMSATQIAPPLASRFLSRGIDFLFFSVLLICITNALVHHFLPRMAHQNYWRLAGGGLFAIFLIVPISGFANLLERKLSDARSTVPAGQWQAYSWLRENAQGEVIAALNWDDIDFIGVYLPNTRTVFGSADLALRLPEAEAARFVATWKDLGLARSHIDDWASAAMGAEWARLAAYSAQTPTPFLSPQDFAASRLASAINYFPYISTFSGSPPIEEGTVPWVSSQDFVTTWLELFDAAPEEFLAREGVSYLLVSDSDHELLPPGALASWTIVFETDKRYIYERGLR
jgi:hypothetical protein